VTIQGVSKLAQVAQYENSEDPNFYGGLTLQDLVGSVSGTDGDVVNAVLGKMGLSGSIGGTGVTFGAQQTSDPNVFLWASGDSPLGRVGDQGKGESALEYISRWDQVSAVHSGP